MQKQKENTRKHRLYNKKKKESDGQSLNCFFEIGVAFSCAVWYSSVE